MPLVKPKTLFFDQGQQALILLHSYTGTPNDMRLMIHQFTRTGLSVYAPLFTGHGTDNPIDILTKGNTAAWWQDTQDAIDFVQSHNKNVLAIFGLSLGSIFALRALENHPEIHGGCVFGSPIFEQDFTNVRAGFFEYIDKIDQMQHLSIAQKAQHKRMAEQLLPSALQAIAKETVLVKENLTNIHQPIFIGHGMDDQLINYHSAEQLRDHLSTTTDFHLYYNAGHVITVNKARPQLEQDLLKFITTKLGV